MKRKILVCLSILLGMSLSIIAQDGTPIQFASSLTPPAPFPYLFCPHVVAGSGGMWQGITIGESTSEQVEDVMIGLSGLYIIEDRINESAIRFKYESYRAAYEQNLPAEAIFCFQDNVVTAFALVLGSRSDAPPKLILDDLVAEYAMPDAVTWGDLQASEQYFGLKKALPPTWLLPIHLVKCAT